jgi:mono/diheme cytochrome c family protein
MRAAAVALLLLSAPAAQAAEPDRITQVTGVAEDYARNCQGCHRADGLGAYGSVPRLRDFVGVFTHLPEGREYLIRVPGVVWAMLDDARLTRLVNWMLATYDRAGLSPDFRPYTVEEVAAARRRPIHDVKATRGRLIAELQARSLLPPDDDGLVSARR